ncbi:resolvase [Streptomyces sp. NPDC059092]|uniref:resolvase n=1 Tax=Streptomyces sp. NPDC059092 TaxID=3346725 RepID=UPI0036CC9717
MLRIPSPTSPGDLEDKAGTVREAHTLENRSLAALARDRGVSRDTIRTAVADLLPDHTGVEEAIPAPESLVTLDMPGKVAGFPRSADLEPAERAALDEGATVRRGPGYTLRVTAIPAVHRQLLDRCQPLDGGRAVPAVPAQRKARREYENRVSTLAPIGP